MTASVPRKIILCLLVFVSAFVFPAAGFAADQEARIGIVLLHGKTGTPSKEGAGLVGPLRHEGFLVEMPEMPWSESRYINADYATALNEIQQAVDKLIERGAQKIVVAGHSFGANAALAFGAYRGNIAGVAMLAPGHTPYTKQAQEKYADALNKSRSLVASGQGNAKGSYPDDNQGTALTVKTTAAIYLSFFEQRGMANMPLSAHRLSPTIPLFYAVGNQDLMFARGKGHIFDRAPANPQSRYVVVNAGHQDTPIATLPELIAWLHELARQ